MHESISQDAKSRRADIVNRVASAVKELREAKGITQNELARRIGSTNTTIMRIELGSDPSLSTVALVAGALGAPVSQLVGDVPAGAFCAPAVHSLAQQIERLSPQNRAHVVALVASLSKGK